MKYIHYFLSSFCGVTLVGYGIKESIWYFVISGTALIVVAVCRSLQNQSHHDNPKN